jgi:hypothetical protein
MCNGFLKPMGNGFMMAWSVVGMDVLLNFRVLITHDCSLEGGFKGIGKLRGAGSRRAL